jgi:hypothetical protein
MRPLLQNLWLAGFILLVSGCQQPDVTPEVISTDAHALEQQWVWDSYQGGFGGLPTTPVSGPSVVQEFAADGTLIRYEDGREVARTPYTRALATSQIYHDQRDIIRSVDGLPVIILKLTANELVVQDDVWDGFTKTYHRKQRINNP